MTGIEEEPSSSELPARVTPAIVLLVVAGAIFYFWLRFTRWAHADHWGDFGSAVGPFVGLLNAGALFAALYSVRLQRRELELQRQELRDTRGEMVEQRKQFKKTAAAQEALAGSTRDLADAQGDANTLVRNANLRAASMEQAQRAHTIAVLMAARVNIQSVTGAAGTLVQQLRPEVEALLKREQEAEVQLREQIAKGKAE
jgi:hypothetical protein